MVFLSVFISAFLFTGCTPSMNLLVKHSNVDTTEPELRVQFEFERKTKNGNLPLDLRRIWIYKNDSLVLDLEKYEYFDDVQSTWDFPSIPRGFKITIPKNKNSMPAFSKKEPLRFEFLAGGSYSHWVHKPNS